MEKGPAKYRSVVTSVCESSRDKKQDVVLKNVEEFTK